MALSLTTKEHAELIYLHSLGMSTDTKILLVKRGGTGRQDELNAELAKAKESPEAMRLAREMAEETLEEYLNKEAIENAKMIRRRFRRELENDEMTLSELALLCGCSEQFIDKYLSTPPSDYHAPPSFDEVCKMAVFFGLELSFQKSFYKHK